MELRWPLALILGALAIVSFVIVRWRVLARKQVYRAGTRAANTFFVKALAAYKRRKRLLARACVAVEVLLVVVLVACAVALARPSVTVTDDSVNSQHDVMLCLDISSSIFEQNERMVDSFQDIVQQLHGERVGIVLFNCSAELYVPLTDDYDYLESRLEDLHDYFLLQRIMLRSSGYTDVPAITTGPYANRYSELETGNYGDEFISRMNVIIDGVVKQDWRGSSIIGEGLATCLYCFPHLDDQDRDRAIILSTDNADECVVTPDVTFEEACQLCASHDVRLYGIYPSSDALRYFHNSAAEAQSAYETNLKVMEDSIEAADGTVYVTNEDKMDTDDIVKSIVSREAIGVVDKTVSYLSDQPLIPYVCMLSAFVLALLVPVVVKL